MSNDRQYELEVGNKETSKARGEIEADLRRIENDLFKGLEDHY